jgi:hypothetical protein
MEQYETPTMEIIYFETEDILTSSGVDWGDEWDEGSGED